MSVFFLHLLLLLYMGEVDLIQSMDASSYFGNAEVCSKKLGFKGNP